MASEMRKSGIDVIGDMAAWGIHFCFFYETKEDLLDALISYCTSGLENEECCLWIVTEPLTIAEATDALKEAVPDLDRHLAESRIEIVSADDFFLQGGTVDRKRVTDALFAKLAGVSPRGYAGVRLTGDTSWVTKQDWPSFCELEEGINEVIGNQRLAVLCTFPLAACGPFELLDTVRNHQFALARRYGNRDIIETAGLKSAKAEIARLNADLEQRVVERTTQLMQASEALREAQMELAHVNRVTEMGQLAASIAHEITQPLTAVATNGAACLRWLQCDQPDLDEACAVVQRVVREGRRSSEVLTRIRGLVQRAPAALTPLPLHETIEEVLLLVRAEARRQHIAVHTVFGDEIPPVLGDRVQVQQVLLNLVRNSMEAMSAVVDRPRDLHVQTQWHALGGVLVSVQDAGIGLRAEEVETIFELFFSTKPGGMGMGLRISRAIVEAHGGQLWAIPNDDHGATFLFTLLTGAEGRV
jgi:C4-dicarboxylate-specific signal transduction histidine kinase